MIHNETTAGALRERIAVTGMGICSAIGNSVDEVTTRLGDGQDRARPITRFIVTPFRTKIAAEVDLPLERLPELEVRGEWDRGTQMAVLASDEALRQSGLLANDARHAVGVAVGVSGSGQFQTAQAGLDRRLVCSELAAEVILEKNVPSFQAEQVASHFELFGPQTTVASASAGSGIALSIGMRWLQAGRCDAALVGGSESLSVLNIIGFDVLGITAAGKCQPFSKPDGMMMGEGAAYAVLERESAAEARGAKVLGYIDGCAVSADAFDPVLFDPTGNGQERAMRRALLDGGAEASDVDWLRASGSGGRDQDAAEIMAVRQVFGDTIPPVTSLEPYFGHCNGAGPMIGLVAALQCLRRGLLPPTLNFDGHGSAPPELDFVPNHARKADLNRALCNSAAFGGTNVAILCSGSESSSLGCLVSPGKRANVDEQWKSDRIVVVDDGLEGSTVDDGVVITGVGVVTCLGHGGRDAFDWAFERATGIGENDRFEMPVGTASVGGLVRDWKPRRTLPSVNLRGADRMTQYAAVATKHAWDDACLAVHDHDADRLGVVCGLSHASGTALEKLMTEVYRDFTKPTVGKLMLRNGRFMVTSQLAHWFGLQGYNATLACGTVSGLNSLLVAADQLRCDDRLDAVAVVAADEVSPMFASLSAKKGWMVRRDGLMAPFGENGTGRILGEGAIAMIVERASHAARRGARVLARICGQAMGYQSDLLCRNENSAFRSTVAAALADARLTREDVGLFASSGTGQWSEDRVAVDSIRYCFGDAVAIASPTGHVGFLPSSGSLLSVAMAASSLQCSKGVQSLSVDGVGQVTSSAEFAAARSTGTGTEHGCVVGHNFAGQHAAVILRNA